MMLVFALLANMDAVSRPNVTLFFQHQFLHISIVLVAGGDDLVSGLEAGKDLIVVGVLTSQLDIHSIGCLAVFADLEDPVAACLLVEAAFGDQYGGGLIAERQGDLQGLAFTDAFGDISHEGHIYLEAAIGNLGIDLDDLELIGFVGKAESSCQACEYPGDIVFVHVGQSYFEPVQHVELSKGSAGGLGLADLCIQGS